MRFSGRFPQRFPVGFEGKCNPRDVAAGPDRLIPPAMRQGKQPFRARRQRPAAELDWLSPTTAIIVLF